MTLQRSEIQVVAQLAQVSSKAAATSFETQVAAVVVRCVSTKSRPSRLKIDPLQVTQGLLARVPGTAQARGTAQALKSSTPRPA